MINYAEKKRRAPVLPNLSNYNLNAGEMNPAIFEMMVTTMKGEGLPLTVWEPFAGTSHPESSPVSKVQDFAQANGVILMSYGLAPKDNRIQVKDSTRNGPESLIGGMLFHPPYFGSSSFSQHPSELSGSLRVDYFNKLRKTLKLAAGAMVNNGLVCAVCRDYRVNGERIRLDLDYIELFRSESFTLIDVWSSEPDVVLIFKAE